MAIEKKTESLKVWMGEKLFVDLNRLAIADDRKLSEYVEKLLCRHVYGHSARVSDSGEGSERVD